MSIHGTTKSKTIAGGDVEPRSQAGQRRRGTRGPSAATTAIDGGNASRIVAAGQHGFAGRCGGISPGRGGAQGGGTGGCRDRCASGSAPSTSHGADSGSRTHPAGRARKSI